MLFTESLKRRTKIVCTIGPNTNSYEAMKKLAECGMNVARLNFSHGTYDVYESIIKNLRKISDELDTPIAILQDLQGPKIRVTTFRDGQVELLNGGMFTLTTRKVEGDATIVGVSYPSFHQDVKPGDKLLLDDGNLSLTVAEVAGQDVHCRVEIGGILKNKKGLNLPNAILSIDALTEKDLADLDFGIDNDVDVIALSFVQRPWDLKRVREIVAAKGKNIPVLAKIEKPQAVENLDAITECCDAVMVARGDLGVEMAVEEVPPAQKRIIEMANRKGLPVITATQMLESMIENPRPTRAEASDVANAVLDGTDAVMLSAETATGKYPYEAVAHMDRIIRLIEMHPRSDRRPAGWEDPHLTVTQSVCFAAVQAADKVNARYICVLTDSGDTAKKVARFRPGRPILAITHNVNTYFRQGLTWGVTPILIKNPYDDVSEGIADIVLRLKKKSLVVTGDRIVVVAGVPFNIKRHSNMMIIETVP